MSLVRHSPDVDDAALRERLETGFASDGFAPSAQATRFTGYADWLSTREVALERFLAREGYTATTGPPRPERFAPITVDHGRAIGEGFVGEAASRRRARTSRPDGREGRHWVFAQGRWVGGLTRTVSCFEWREGRWCLLQHYPDAAGLTPPGVGG